MIWWHRRSSSRSYPPAELGRSLVLKVKRPMLQSSEPVDVRGLRRFIRLHSGPWRRKSFLGLSARTELRGVAAKWLGEARTRVCDERRLLDSAGTTPPADPSCGGRGGSAKPERCARCSFPFENVHGFCHCVAGWRKLGCTLLDVSRLPPAALAVQVSAIWSSWLGNILVAFALLPCPPSDLRLFVSLRWISAEREDVDASTRTRMEQYISGYCPTRSGHGGEDHLLNWQK
ncbi:hypothetical protein BV20DRAFT_563448 [Pilatotrama ljubarskyi]|nr:hypothetical protein BV20DRAFT_563448 [Pilatotrama ljubarskyi]